MKIKIHEGKALDDLLIEPENAREGLAIGLLAAIMGKYDAEIINGILYVRLTPKPIESLEE